MPTEYHTMKLFRDNEKIGLGVIRLNDLAYPGKDRMKIVVGGREIHPKGFDTYGHPVISADNVKYYQALRANFGRKQETFLLEVTYDSKPFCVKREIFDSEDSILKAVSEQSLEDLKTILVYRKQYFFINKGKDEPLKSFILFGKYELADDGHIYKYSEEENDKVCSTEENNVEVVKAKTHEGLRGKEVHFPGKEDVCAICGKPFTMKDIEDGKIAETDECEKVHFDCYQDFKVETGLYVASRIIDTVYNKPTVEIKIEGERIWYIFTTNKGKIKIAIENDEIIIEWSEDFIPFDIEKLEQVKKLKFSQRAVCVWNQSEAIHCIDLIEKSQA